VSFPVAETQLPRPEIPGIDDSNEPTDTLIRYVEGPDVGYRWFAKTGASPLFPFGFGLSYTRFEYRRLQVTGGAALTARFEVQNTGPRAGVDTPQLYLTDLAGHAALRLLGWSRLTLAPGETRSVSLTADPRLLARFDPRAGNWRIAAGTYKVAVGASSTDLPLQGSTSLMLQRVPP
jgi:beta-glucosidase